MSSQEWNNTDSARQDADIIDLRLLAKAIWRRRRMVLTFVVLGMVGGLALSYFYARYVSRGLLLTPNSTLAQYKRWEEALNNEPRLETFLRAIGKQNQPVADQMRNLVQDRSRMQEAVTPEFSFTDRDAKQFGVKVDGQATLIGVHLALHQRERAQEAPVFTLAEYVRDTAIRIDLESVILDSCLTHGLKQQQLRNEQLQGEFNIAQLEARAMRLREIAASHPKAETDVRQVVSVENGGDKFLPPATQLATTEIGIADARLAETRRERDRIAAEIRTAYYCEARKLVESDIGGRELLGKLVELRKQVLQGKDEKIAIVEQTSNEIALQCREWSDRYLDQMRFVASPQGAQYLERKPGRALGALFGLALGAFAGVFFALALAWWRRNRTEIVAGEV